jgi:hypothetical protein
VREVILAHETHRAGDPQRVRGTVLVSSLRSLRRRGLGDRYMAALEPRFHEDIASLTAATWLPMELALAHYGACQNLGLHRATVDDIGAETGRFINETVLTTVSKLSRESGLTPWFALPYSQKLVARTWLGTSMAVWRVGPKDAQLEWVRQPCARYPYFRTAFAAFAAGILAMFAQSIHVRELPHVSDEEMTLRFSWV